MARSLVPLRDLLKLVPLRDLLKQQNIGVGGIQKDQNRNWVLDLGDGRQLRLIPQQGGTYRMELRQSDGTVVSASGDARLINGHFVLGQQAADSLRRLLGSTVRGTSQPAGGGGPTGDKEQTTAGGDTTGGLGRGLVYAGRFPTDEEVWERLLRGGISGPLVPPPSAAGGQPGQQPQQPSRSRSWLEEVRDLLKEIGPWLVLAMIMTRGDQRSQNQHIVWV